MVNVAPSSSSSAAPEVHNRAPTSEGQAPVSSDRWFSHLPTLAKCTIFNGNNLIAWERAIETALKPRKLLKHLQEDCPPEDSPLFQRWVSGEEVVFAWLLDSISPDYISKFISYNTSRALWEAIRRNHSKLGDKARINDLFIRSYSLKQGEKDILTYSNELRAIHTELDYCWPQSTDPVARAQTATSRLCQLLHGLRPEFEFIRSQLFNREVEPSFDEAISKLLQEESRLQFQKGTLEGSAYAAPSYRPSPPSQPQYQKENTPRYDSGRRENLVCAYCKKQGHHKDKCYKLHGFPPYVAKAHIVQNSQQEGASSNTAEALQGMMKELQKLTTIINSSATSIIGSTSVANSGIKTLISSFHLNSQGHPWILDSGATDHMTLTNKFFKSYEPIAPGKHVQTADGTLLPVAGLGTMEIPPIGLITHVLHVPKLFVNLISVQKLAKLTEYQIIFDDIDAYLFHKVQKSRIGLARI